jgi:UDP-N-acetylmuramoyl-L-alanyl-D-glutamate--2,6-diaminopimelate ligase
MFSFLRKIFPNHHPVRLYWHKAKAILAAIIYRFPADRMTVIAVTGTNGKTTTCNVLHKIFTEAGHKVGLFTTVNFKVGEHEETNLTGRSTISPFKLQRKLKYMADQGCDIVVIEATSHAIVQSRMWGVTVDTAVFTNLTQDHLDYHGTMQEYKEAKGRLWKGLNSSKRKPNVQKLSVINKDDPSEEYFAEFPVDQLFEYGIQRGTYNARNLEVRPDGTKFLFKIPNGQIEIDFRIPGRVNVYNAIAAATVAVAHHINLNTIKAALEKMQPVPGRGEVIDEGQPYTVVVDYAHTEDALQNLLSMFRELTQGKLIVVFGATGDRDKKKRPKMGEVIHKYADTIIVTNDDLYTEDPKQIAAMLREGIPREEGDGLWQVLDRKEATRLALEMAREGDTVIVAGKGAEEFQVLATGKVPYDDRKVVREILAREVDIEVPE